VSLSLLVLNVIQYLYSNLNVCLKSKETVIDNNEKSCNRISFVTLNENFRAKFK
jgi:hypothetical protein